MTAPLTQSLPDDIDALKALLLKKEQRIDLLEEQIRLLKQKRFGASSEKSDQQVELFDEAELGDAEVQLAPQEDEPVAVATAPTAVSAPKAKRGRKPL